MKYFSHLMLGCCAALFAQTHPPSLDEFLAASDPWLGTPYLFDPVGDLIEGPWKQPGAPDRPTVPASALDCVSFVDDVLARIYGDSPTSIEVIRTHLRYQHAPYDWFHRNHFTDIDWIPAAEAYLTPYGSEHLAHVSQRYDLPKWWQQLYEQSIKQGPLTPEQSASFEQNIQNSKIQDITLTYWPWHAVVANDTRLNRFDPLDGYGWAVVLFVRHEWPKEGQKLLISHLGFLWNKDDTLILRHAGRQHGVEDVPFVDYIRDKTTNASWLGVMVLRPKPKEDISCRASKVAPR